MTRLVPAKLFAFLEQHEALRLTAYLDSAGVWTVGYGHTGPEVARGYKVTAAKAKTLLRQDIGVAVGKLYARVAADVIDLLTENQYAALLSFVFNAGAKSSWTVWKVLKAGHLDRVPIELARFIYVRDPKTEQMVKSKGLINRRAAEVALWHEGDVTVSPASFSSASTREIDTPPVSSDAKPLSQSKSFMTAGATAITVGSVAVGEVTKAVSPFAAQSEMVARIVSTLALIAAALAVATLLFNYLKKRRSDQ